MANMHELRRRASQLAYLGEASKVMAALANEYGRDHKLPPRKSIQHMIDEHKRKRFNRQPEDRIGNAHVAQMV